jgi:hypothetical protein
MRRVVWLTGLAWLFTMFPSASFAQDEAAPDEAEQASSDSSDEAGEPSGETQAGEAGAEAADGRAEAPAADSGKPPTWWVGAYFEGVMVPAFMLDVFLGAAPTVFGPGVGATITHRDADGFSWVLGLGYASYGFEGPFRAKGDPDEDTEYLDSSLGLLHVRGQLLWSVELSKMISFEYGVGVELGVLLGKLVRTEAYHDPVTGEFKPCRTWLDPDPVYCEQPTNPTTGLPQNTSNAYNEQGAHYGVVEKRVPPIGAGLMVPALALRITPVRQLAIKAEVSYGLFQFTFGLSAAYGFE